MLERTIYLDRVTIMRNYILQPITETVGTHKVSPWEVEGGLFIVPGIDLGVCYCKADSVIEFKYEEVD